MGRMETAPEGCGPAWGEIELAAHTLPAAVVVPCQSWPAELKGDLVWSGGDSFGSEEEYVLVLNEYDVLEVRAAVEHFNDLGLYGSEVSSSNFPLPALGEKLRRVTVDVHRGKGFGVIRGLNPEDFSPEDNVVIFLGISSYIGPVRGRQDEDGNMLAHIRDAKLSKAAQADRPTRYSKRASTFHTDTFCDILALQTRNCAAVGGRNILSSSWTVYNKLVASRPDVRDLLAQPIWPFDSRGKFFSSGTRPLLFHQDGKIILNFAREPLLGLDGVRRQAGLACLSPAQREALDLLETFAQESQVVLDAEPGDLLFINNHAVLHSREAFEDAPGGASGRYLVRMWLRNEELAWDIPGPLREGHERIYGVNDLGKRWNVVDVPRVVFRLSERLTS